MRTRRCRAGRLGRAKVGDVPHAGVFTDRGYACNGGLETAITVPSGALSRNLMRDCASTNSSNKPAIGVLPFCGLPARAATSPRKGSTAPAPSSLEITSPSDQQIAAGNQPCARARG